MEDILAIIGVLTVGSLYLTVLVKMKKKIDNGEEI